MGRKSALSPDQWIEVERRHLVNGESVNSLAKEFGVNESAIRRKIKPNKSEGGNGAKSLTELARDKVASDLKVREIAEQIAELPYAKQEIVNSLADRFRRISGHLAGAAEYGAATAHRLSGIAHAKVQEIDDAKPLDEESLESLKGVAVLTRLANDASTIGMNLLNANKEMAKGAQQEEPVQPVRIVVQVEDASQPEPDAKQAAG